MMVEFLLILIVIGAIGFWLHGSTRRSEQLDLIRYKSYAFGNASLQGKNVHFCVQRGAHKQQYCEIDEGKVTVQNPASKVELFIESKNVMHKGRPCRQHYVGTMIINEKFQYTHKPGQFSRYLGDLVNDKTAQEDVVHVLSFMLESMMANNKMRKRGRLFQQGMTKEQFQALANDYQQFKKEAGKLLADKVGQRPINNVNEYLSILELDSSQSISFEDIKNRYRAMAKRYHPDSPTGDVHKFKLVKEAYEHARKAHVAV